MNLDGALGLHGWRRPAQAALWLAGLAAIVGSGGNPVDLGCLFCGEVIVNPPPPQIEAQVPLPPALQVGESAIISVYTSATWTVPQPLTYQWCRAEDNASPCVDIPGATDGMYVVASVTLRDDGAIFGVTVRGGDAMATAQGTLHVSNTAPLAFEDGEFTSGSWTVATIVDGGGPLPTHHEQREAQGGHPDAYLHVVQSTPAGEALYKIFYLSPTAIYDPSMQGALYAVDFALDAVSLDPVMPLRRNVLPLVEQSGRRFVGGWAYPSATFDDIRTDWFTATTHRLYARGDFQSIDGVDCGEPVYGCIPDFSASAPPLRFGFAFYISATGPETLNWGIDNWKVTVWRR